MDLRYLIFILHEWLTISVIMSVVGLIVSILWYRAPFNKSIRKQYLGMKDTENEEEKKKQKRKYGFLVLYGFLILVMINRALFLLFVATHPTTYAIVSLLCLVVLFYFDMLRNTPYAVIRMDMVHRSIILVLPVILFQPLMLWLGCSLYLCP